MMTQLPQEFFTLQSMLTLTGATGATFVIANGLQRAFNFNPRWLALLIAQVICIFGVYATHQEEGAVASDYFVGVVNGFLVYCTAAGATAIGGSPTGDNMVARGGGDAAPFAGRRRFLSSWF